MKLLSLAIALASAAPALSVSVWGQCGVGLLLLYPVLTIID